jgi:hypothetical protein
MKFQICFKIEDVSLLEISVVHEKKVLYRYDNIIPSAPASAGIRCIAAY